jgi:hypothetical protein
MSSLIIVFFSIALLLGVLWQKTHSCRSIRWWRERKMIIQLLSISILYLFSEFSLGMHTSVSVIWFTIEFCTHLYAICLFYWLLYYISFAICLLWIIVWIKNEIEETVMLATTTKNPSFWTLSYTVYDV